MSSWETGAIVGAAFGFLGTVVGAVVSWYQVRAKRWEMAGQVERTDAQVLWDTQLQLIRELLANHGALLERFDRLTSRLEAFSAQLVDLGQQIGTLAERLDGLASEVEMMVESQKRTEEAVQRINGDR